MEGASETTLVILAPKGERVGASVTVSASFKVWGEMVMSRLITSSISGATESVGSTKFTIPAFNTPSSSRQVR